jgi:hypothetical protein
VQNTVLVRVMHGAGDLCDELYRLPDRKRHLFNDFVEPAAFDELHAEIALAIALAYLIDRHNTWMIETRGGFGFQSEAFYVRLCGPLTKADHF